MLTSAFDLLGLFSFEHAIIDVGQKLSSRLVIDLCVWSHLEHHSLTQLTYLLRSSKVLVSPIFSD